MEKLPSTGGIEAFALISKGYSIAAAAKKLNLTASAVSRRIVGLEITLGTALVNRQGPQLRLTPAGEIYAKKLSPIIASLHQASGLVRQQPDDRTLCIASGSTFYANRIAPRLGSFLEVWPDANIKLVTYDMLDPGSYGHRETAREDIRIRSCHTKDALSGEKRLFDYEVTPFCRHDLFERHTIALPTELVRVPLIEHASVSDAWPRWFLSAGVQNHDSAQRIVVDSSFLMYESVVNGIGVACLPLIYATGLKARGLIPIFPEVSAYLCSVFVSITVSQPRPIVRAFRDWIIAEVGA
ncbi:MAG: LysR substrate-binding domain-containing protein [Georgfuchsia sp.]